MNQEQIPDELRRFFIVILFMLLFGVAKSQSGYTITRATVEYDTIRTGLYWYTDTTFNGNGSFTMNHDLAYMILKITKIYKDDCNKCWPQTKVDTFYLNPFKKPYPKNVKYFQ